MFYCERIWVVCMLLFMNYTCQFGRGVKAAENVSVNQRQIIHSQQLRDMGVIDVRAPEYEEYYDIEDEIESMQLTVSIETKQISDSEFQHRRLHLLEYLIESSAQEDIPISEIDAITKLETLTFGAGGMQFQATMEFLSLCSNVPPNAFTDCNTLSLGLCQLPAFIEGNYCQESCGRCCGDVEYLGSCATLQEMGLCEAPEVVAGFFCQSSCGRCEGALLKPPMVIPAPPPPPSPLSAQGCKAPTAIACDAQALMEFHDSMSEAARMSLASWSWGTDPCTRDWKGVRCREISGVKRVSEVSVSFTYMQTSIPPMLSLMNYLDILNLDQCNLVGTLPPELSALQNIKEVDVWKNELTGTLPVEYSTWKTANEVHLSFNKFQGEVPVEYSELLPMGYFYLEPQDQQGLCISQQLKDIVMQSALHTNVLSLPVCK
eukprot:TRINITY_DN896_c0_g1_i1.p1 TRINITY_DN896_c0_g1~~TRINITY_DN896_c0_g1_i1.p1  ORF type:complete len:473 (-),score=48.24 TRINITY_DN896_c0_g1_i1:3031-4326(-)